MLQLLDASPDGLFYLINISSIGFTLLGRTAASWQQNKDEEQRVLSLTNHPTVLSISPGNPVHTAD
jgi:hypothetical protein